MVSRIVEDVCKHHDLAEQTRAGLMTPASESELNTIKVFMNGAEQRASKESCNFQLMGNDSCDWYSLPRTAGKFHIPTQQGNTWKEFTGHLTTLYNKGIPTLMAELLTKEFKFFLDVQVHFSNFEDNSVDLSKFYDINSDFLKTVADCIFNGFPLEAQKACDIEHREAIRAVILASKPSTSKPKMLTVRFTFIKLIVDTDIALKMRNYICNELRARTGDGNQLEDLLLECRKCHADNQEWEQLIPGMYQQRSRVLLPYCDFEGTFAGKGAKSPLVPQHGLKMAKNENGVQVAVDEPSRTFAPVKWWLILKLGKPDGTAMVAWNPPVTAKSELPPVDKAAEIKRNRVHKPLPGYE
eukprot:GEMP01055311.1.p1 GENE.GEMP01055311.1~~GEMP01055311.1.p1  ORF type:complete len:354 (+),score=71.89 GEMP01055311.1:94-1155(+)